MPGVSVVTPTTREYTLTWLSTWDNTDGCRSIFTAPRLVPLLLGLATTLWWGPAPPPALSLLRTVNLSWLSSSSEGRDTRWGRRSRYGLRLGTVGLHFQICQASDPTTTVTFLTESQSSAVETELSSPASDSTLTISGKKVSRLKVSSE